MASRRLTPPSPARPLAVADSHDLAVGGAGRHLERRRAAGRVDHQGVVARRFEGRFDAREDSAPIVLDRRDLAVHDGAGAHDAAAECHPDRLVAQAYPEQGHAPPGAGPHHLDGDAGAVRLSRARRDHHAVGIEREQLRHRGRVVAEDVHLRAKLAQILDEVVREGIVVVDHQQAHRGQPQSIPSRAMSMA
jgi:hypothetical protein